MGKKHEYVGVVEKGAAMFLDGVDRPGGLIQETVCAAVKFTGDGRIVQRGRSYRGGDATAKAEGLQKRAERMAEKWNSYLRRTGKRFELETDAKAKAKADKRRAEREARQKLAAKAPELRDALAALAKAVRFSGCLEADLRAEMVKAEALLNDL